MRNTSAPGRSRGGFFRSLIPESQIPPMNPLRIAVHGAAGRMGRRLIALGAADPQLAVVAAVEAAGHPLLGQDAGTLAGIAPLGVALAADLTAAADVMVDFSVPAAVRGLDRKLPPAAAATGGGDDRAGRAAARRPAGRGYGNPLGLVAQHEPGRQPDDETLRNGRQGPGRQGRRCRDARTPSSLQRGRAQRHGDPLRRDHRRRDGPDGPSPRPPGHPGKRPHAEIGYHAVRVGDDPGQHTIVFGMLGETIEFSVCATNRDCYALGRWPRPSFWPARPPASTA